MQTLAAAAAPHIYKMIPGAMGVELWRQRAPAGFLSLLKFFRISLVASASRRNVDRLAATNDAKIKTWKSVV